MNLFYNIFLFYIVGIASPQPPRITEVSGFKGKIAPPHPPRIFLFLNLLLVRDLRPLGFLRLFVEAKSEKSFLNISI